MSEDAENGEGRREDGPPEPPAPESEPAPETEPEQKFADRCYRSPAAMAGGVVLLALGVWLVGDAVLSGDGRTPLTALAALVCAAPLVIAFTLRPAVYAGDTRMRIRNPFRTITVPWGAVESVRAGYSSEVVADGTKYQLWAIPVSLRARKKANRHNERIASGQGPAPRPGGVFGLGGRAVPEVVPNPADLSDKRAPSDQAVDELRELLDQHAESEAAQGGVAVRWAYEVVGPALVGAIALAVLLATG
ncbi:PH domain-containing protein [Streptomyces sp. NPDC048172]|uniref:PH domain-containing protein n=1 Tax=Streptomyces sp. NPDC048172 TaxID=3365505 RepID=UPI003710D279